jgi:hypothetical protein
LQTRAAYAWLATPHCRPHNPKPYTQNSEAQNPTRRTLNSKPYTQKPEPTSSGVSHLNVHQTLGALKMPLRSYTTTVSSLEIPSASAAAANARSDGSMCGRSVLVSAILSMSKKRLPGILTALNSSVALRSARNTKSSQHLHVRTCFGWSALVQQSQSHRWFCFVQLETQQIQCVASRVVYWFLREKQPWAHSGVHLPSLGMYHVPSRTLMSSSPSLPCRAHRSLTPPQQQDPRNFDRIISIIEHNNSKTMCERP